MNIFTHIQPHTKQCYIQIFTFLLSVLNTFCRIYSITKIHSPLKLIATSITMFVKNTKHHSFTRSHAGMQCTGSHNKLSNPSLPQFHSALINKAVPLRSWRFKAIPQNRLLRYLFHLWGRKGNFFLPNRKNAGCQGLPEDATYMHVRECIYNF